MMPVELRNAQRSYRLDTRALRRDAQRLLEAVGCPEATLSILLTDDRQMSQLHERWMGEKGPTDVLAFPQEAVGQGKRVEGKGNGASFSNVPFPFAPSPFLGDVAISVETARRRNPSDPEREIRRYLVHGLLHLVGRDHAGKEERLRMQKETRRLLLVLQDT